MSKYQVETTVNGKQYIKRDQPWFNAYMDAQDIVSVLRTQPAFSKPETSIAIVIKDAGTNTVAATYDKNTGWTFA